MPTIQQMINNSYELKNSPQEFFNEFKNDQSFIRAIEVYYWGGVNKRNTNRKRLQPYCPHCKSSFVKCINLKYHRHLYQCNNKNCRAQFNVFTDTPFYRSKVLCKKWFYIYWYYKKEFKVNNIVYKMELKKRDVDSIIKKLQKKDEEIKGEYIWQIRNNYLKYLGKISIFS